MNLKNFNLGKNAPQVVNVIIEIPQGSDLKYEFDKEQGMIVLDRFLHSSVHYPGDYGFLPNTLCDDGDPLDVVVYTRRSVHPGVAAPVRILGVMKVVDGGEQDDKLIGVYDCDPHMKGMSRLEDLPEHVVKEIKEFYVSYKKLEGKSCDVQEILGKEAAYTVIADSIALFNKK